jgi:hypothetical protein
MAQANDVTIPMPLSSGSIDQPNVPQEGAKPLFDMSNARPIGQPKPLFDMSSSRPIGKPQPLFDMSNARPIGKPAAAPTVKSAPVAPAPAPQSAFSRGEAHMDSALDAAGRFGQRLGQSLGIPTNKAELTAAGTPPSLPEAIAGPGPSGIYNQLVQSGKTLYQGAKDTYREAKEAGQNIAAGGPVLQNIAKPASTILNATVGAVPFIGAPTVQAGEDVAAKNYAGAAGGLTGVLGQVALEGAGERRLGTDEMAFHDAKVKEATAALKEAKKAATTNYKASIERDIKLPKEVQKPIDTAQAALDEAKTHQAAAKEAIAQRKVAPPAPEVPTEQVQAQPQAPKPPKPPTPTMRKLGPAENVKTPGQVQPETFPQQPTGRMTPMTGQRELPNQQGRMGMTKMLTEAPQHFPQEVLPPERTASPAPEAKAPTTLENGPGKLATPEPEAAPKTATHDKATLAAVEEQLNRGMGNEPVKPGVPMKEQGKPAEPATLSSEPRKAVLQKAGATPEEIEKILPKGAKPGQTGITKVEMSKLAEHFGVDMGDSAIGRGKGDLAAGTHMTQDAVLQKIIDAGHSPADIAKAMDEGKHLATVAGGAPEDQLAEHEKNGGSTFSADGKDLNGTDKYSVGAYPDRTEHVDNLTTEKLEEFKKKNSDVLSKEDHAVGTWKDPDTGKTVLDVAKTYADRDEAIAAGKAANQKSIYHLGGEGEIQTGGTGKQNAAAEKPAEKFPTSAYEDKGDGMHEVRTGPGNSLGHLTAQDLNDTTVQEVSHWVAKDARGKGLGAQQLETLSQSLPKEKTTLVSDELSPSAEGAWKKFQSQYPDAVTKDAKGVYKVDLRKMRGEELPTASGGSPAGASQGADTAKSMIKGATREADSVGEPKPDATLRYVTPDGKGLYSTSPHKWLAEQGLKSAGVELKKGVDSIGEFTKQSGSVRIVSSHADSPHIAIEVNGPVTPKQMRALANLAKGKELRYDVWGPKGESALGTFGDFQRAVDAAHPEPIDKETPATLQETLPDLAKEHLTPEEKAGVTKSAVGRQNFIDNLKKLPSVQEFTDIAKAIENGKHLSAVSGGSQGADTEPEYTDRGHGLHEVVTGPADNRIGHLLAHDMEGKPDTTQVASHWVDKEERGKGVGTSQLETLAKSLPEGKKTLLSDDEMTDSAKRSWDKFQSQHPEAVKKTAKGYSADLTKFDPNKFRTQTMEKPGAKKSPMKKM